ncbi:transcriptional regulator [Bacterioplanes sanyensis]|uniref:Transcriptional regulator n=1 Tax=Bacterioplanes sanyensis TaxID=1249553 RepID=A0A222FIG1_9GAMM|nr:GlxA family transcriptional regulator [Bacterioplanes sanyensis]ASP38560.1 transcriptional regulator [Bacterioplanes sanyensis]
MKVCIVLLPYCSSMSVAAAMEFFEVANALSAYAQQSTDEPVFQVSTASPDGQAVMSSGGLSLQAQYSFAQVDECDLVLIPGFLFKVTPLLAQLQSVVPWLQQRYEQGSYIASMCTGAFVSAAAGLLDGKQASTHWLFVDKFRQLYPAVKLRPEKAVTDDQRVMCSGGATTGGDLLLYIVRKFCSPQLALECSKKMLMDSGERQQTAYASEQFRRQHDDPEVQRVQLWLEQHCHQAIVLDDVATQFGFSSRNFVRRFRLATGAPPVQYLQNLRLEKARLLLETTRISFEKITLQVGYEDSNSFRRLFKQRVGLSPAQYRQKFLLN